MPENKTQNQITPTRLPQDFLRETLLEDYYFCILSREVSVAARKEVLTGKAKFGIIGDGKELPQVVLARLSQPGDFRSGYYRDQTWLFATGQMTVAQFFAQLYADTKGDPFSGGRQMNCHFSTPTLDEKGNWANLMAQFNVSADLSSTGGQMARALGLAQASQKYRQLPDLHTADQFSNGGNEVSLVSIGDASTSEGVFWETMNAAAVLQVPLGVFIWDDGYGISVPREFQTVKSSISDALRGFEKQETTNGIRIYTVKGYDYVGLVQTFQTGIALMREEHVPALFHVQDLTQPQGHSTSGSHERYKKSDRLAFEVDFDCISHFKKWLLDNALVTDDELDSLATIAKKEVRDGKKKAWEAAQTEVNMALAELNALYLDLAAAHPDLPAATLAQERLKKHIQPAVSEVVADARKTLQMLLEVDSAARQNILQWSHATRTAGAATYAKHLYAEHEGKATAVPAIAPIYPTEPIFKNGYEILNAFFDAQFAAKPELLAFGEDVGQIGDVNQGFMGLQEKFGVERVFDVGIREWTIMGQAIGMAMRGLRPIAEIQYLDYLIYGLSPLSDDLATLRWRSNGTQAAPAIIRTRGHRLEGVWHAGSPMGLLLNSLRGLHICVPRDMTRAAGMYNTLLQSMDPGLVIECLNGYRLKEALPSNLLEFTIPLGLPEILQVGTDLTLVTYGSCVRIAQRACERLADLGITVELIDVQTLLPFDTTGVIGKSLQKTNRLLVVDEDIPGGASAFIIREVLETQNGYQYLDAAPQTLTAAQHRPPYGSDGDYFGKPSPDDVFEKVYAMMQEAEPKRWSAKF